MPNLRIVSDNALERASSFTASSTAGSLVAANMMNWKKSSIWRATALSARITALFTTPEPIQFVGFPFCNWSPTCSMRVRVSQEAAATNLFRYSAAFDNAAWVNTGTTIGLNATAAPDGTVSAERLIETATTADHIMTSTATVVAGQSYTFSLFVKADTRKRLRVAFPAAQFAANERATFDVTSNTVPNSTGGAPTIVPSAGGWDRITLTGACTTSGTATITIYMMPDTGTSTTSYAGATTSSIFVWGAQLEAGAVATSYYPTTTAAATRPAGYIDTWQSYDYDATVFGCPWPAPKLRGFTAAQAASAYAYGGGTYARHWLPTEFQARGIAVDISDPDNVQGYLEAACMVAGPCWSPKYNASAAGLTPLDGSDSNTTGGGDTYGTPGFISKEIPVDMSYMEPEDGMAVMDMALNSAVYPLLVSLCPDDPDPRRERKFMALATRSKSSAISMKFAAGYTTSLTFKEV